MWPCRPSVRPGLLPLTSSRISRPLPRGHTYYPSATFIFAASLWVFMVMQITGTVVAAISTTDRYHTSYMQDSCTCSSIAHLQCQAYRLGPLVSGAASVALSRNPRFNKEFYCQFTIEAPPGHRILIRLNELSVPISRGCKAGMLKISDGESGQQSTPLAGLCGTNAPKFSYRSNTDRVTLSYHQMLAILWKPKSFNLTFTYFRMGHLDHSPCNRSKEFPCYNGLCIGRNLECDGYNNCGDGTDESMDYNVCGKLLASSDPIVGLAVGVTVASLLLVGVLAGVAYGLRRRKAQLLYAEQTPMTVIQEHIQSNGSLDRQPSVDAANAVVEDESSPSNSHTGIITTTTTTTSRLPRETVVRISVSTRDMPSETSSIASATRDTLPPSYSTLFPEVLSGRPQ